MSFQRRDEKYRTYPERHQSRHQSRHQARPKASIASGDYWGHVLFSAPRGRAWLSSDDYWPKERPRVNPQYRFKPATATRRPIKTAQEVLRATGARIQPSSKPSSMLRWFSSEELGKLNDGGPKPGGTYPAHHDVIWKWPGAAH